MQAGLYNELTIVRKTDLGYMLKDYEGEVLLHFAEAKSEHNINDKVKVFLYYDKKGRLCATENEVNVTLEHPGFVKVVDVNSSTGVFVNNNTGKDVLISLDYLPYDYKKWPEVDDALLVNLKVKSNTILAKPLNKVEIDDLSPNIEYEMGSYQEAYVYRVGNIGLNCVTKDMVNVFVHKSMLRNTYHVGQMIVVKVVYKADSGYNGSLIEAKEKMIDSDSELILTYLKQNGGKMHLDAKSPSEEIDLKLHLSRKAFKRALGSLYKDHIVDFKDGYTILLK